MYCYECAALVTVLLFAAFGASAAPPRMQAPFHSGWRFLRGDAQGAEQEGFDDSGWRTVELPHDWSIEDLPPAAASGPSLALTPGSWRVRLGDDAAWKEPGFDDSSWREVQLPAGWRASLGEAPANSYGWYRRRFQVPGALKGKAIELVIGKVDDADETFVNGVKVGAMGSMPPTYASAWQASRRYSVPASLLKGDGSDVVAVRVYNGEGDGGIYAAAAASRRSGPFDADSESDTAQGYTLGGVGWYRNTFRVATGFRGKSIGLSFDGVYMNAQFWLNGQPIARHPYGYTGFHLDLTPHVRFGKPNVLAVRVDASGRTSRWYSGAGIFRQVWMILASPTHIADRGVYVTTPEVSQERATVRVRTQVECGPRGPRPVSVSVRVVDPAGETVASDTSEQTLVANATHEYDQTLTVPHPRLWSPDSPTLYRLVTTVVFRGSKSDEVVTPFGIRTVSVDARRGLLLNGAPLKLRGGCVHHDNGPLGSRTYDRAEERRVEILKASGYNAIRTSHNPPSSAFLDACDRLGVLVMDEAFDCWRHGKNGQDYGRFFDDWWRADVDSMVLRDRNHPSVIFWSLGNEIPEQSKPEGAEEAAMLAARVRELDPTRPVAMAFYPDATGDAKMEAVCKTLDVCGYNYMPANYAPDHAKYPERVIAGTESFPAATFEAWMGVVDHPWVLGDFVWTAMDYIGEAGIGKTAPQSMPPGYHDDRLWTVSNCGDIDLIGDKRPQSYYRDAVWGVKPNVSCFAEALGPDGKPEVVQGWGWPDERPSWTWPGREGQPVTVRVYSSCPRVRLLLNGRDLGVRDTTRATKFTGLYEVPYEPGKLEAVGLAGDGSEAARWTLDTAGSASALRMTSDTRELAAYDEDLAFVTVDVVDEAGKRQPNADNVIEFSLSGPGEIVAVGNADPRSEESFQQPRRKAFRGRCLVVVKAVGRQGTIRLMARSAGLAEAHVEVSAVSRLDRAAH